MGDDCYRGGGGILKSWANRYRGGILESSVILSNDVADMYNRGSVWGQSRVGSRRGGFYSVIQWSLLRKGDGRLLSRPWGCYFCLQGK